METPFPRATLTLINQQQCIDNSEEISSVAFAKSSSVSAVHDLEELFFLAFPNSFERRLRLVPAESGNVNATVP